MVMLNTGLNRIRDLVNADIDKGQVGINGTVALASNTGLTSPISSTLLSTTNTISDKQLNLKYTLLSTQGETNTLKEFELTSSTSSTSYDRIVFTGVSFTLNGSEDLIISKRYFFRGL